MATWLHAQRLEAVCRVVSERRPRHILDLGCGNGDLFIRLAAMPWLERLIGIDLSPAALRLLADRLEKADRAPIPTPRPGDRDVAQPSAQIELVAGSVLEVAAQYPGFDCALLVETIEHIDPDRLSVLERALFREARPAAIVVTTPNADFNPLLGVPLTRFRHPDHRFEWSREKFRRWADGVAARTGYAATHTDIAGHHPTLGGASQMAVFTL